MRGNVGTRRFVPIGLAVLAIGVGQGCGGEPNEEGIKGMGSTVAPDAPTSMEEHYQQQMQGNTSKPSS